jgi:hypothetical protein
MKTAYLRIIALPILAMFLMACGPKLELPEGVPSPCDIEQEPLGSMAKVGGEINFLDDSIPGEIYADLEADGCRIGLTVRTETLDGWGPQAKEAIQMGAQIIIEGRLDELPLPARPDEFQYVIALQYPPTLLNESSLVDQPPEEPPLASLSGPACDLSEFDAMERIAWEGQLVAVDDSAAAGVAGELERDGCHIRFWIEARYWDQWSQAERALFKKGAAIKIDGLLTYVLGEAVIDIADPPVSG